MFCAYRWWASRIEYDTVPVQHVCALRSPHPGQNHTCICGADEDEEDANDR